MKHGPFTHDCIVFPNKIKPQKVQMPLPIYLLADSQLLFWHQNQEPFLASVRRLLKATEPNVAYLGASNGDEPQFFEIFQSAMESAGIRHSRHIRARPDEASLAFLRHADLILLAGGDVKRGWEAFECAGILPMLEKRYREGSLLMGISAGAMQLGTWSWEGDLPEPGKLFKTLGLVPAVISPHMEPHWPCLHLAMELSQNGEDAFLGIPSGGGVIHHPDRRFESLRRKAYWLSNPHATPNFFSTL